MTLIQISDCHLLESPARSGYGDINPLQSLEAVLKTVVSLDVDGVLVTGDISGDDSEQSYQHFIQAINQHLPDIPVKVIAGNHDNNALFDTLLSPWLLTPDNGYFRQNRCDTTRTSQRTNAKACKQTALTGNSSPPGCNPKLDGQTRLTWRAGTGTLADAKPGAGCCARTHSRRIPS